MKKRKWLISVLAGFAAVVLADVYGFLEYSRAYTEKLEIISILVEQSSEESSVKAAFGLLKGEFRSGGAEELSGDEQDSLSTMESGAGKLKQYGYLEEGGNIYSQEKNRGIRRLLLGSLGIYGAYLAAVWYIFRCLKEKKEAQLEEISYLLEQFQKKNYDTRLETEPEKESRVMCQIQEQLESIGERMKQGEASMQQEKEETRAMVTDISHQLKTPVAALKACFEILQRENLTREEREEFSIRCSQQLSGLEELLSALLNISRMETGMIEIKKEPADIFETLVSAVNRVYVKARKKEIVLELEEGEASSFVIPHDVKWTVEAFINLLENAVKYSPRGGNITIRISRNISFLRVEIQDQGIGIPKEEYHKIFKRFYRGQSEQVKQAEGSGVGLYLTREIIGRQGGSVTVSSKCGGEHPGSTFLVQLPFRQ